MAIIYNGTYCVYAHINKINGKIYIGQTIHGDNPVKRWGCNGAHYKAQPYFYNAIQKWGWDSFDHEVIANHLTAKEADEFEKLLIKKLNTTDSNFGYNLTSGGKSYEMTEATKKKISESHKGKTLSEETKKKLSVASRAAWENEDMKKHASERNSGKNNAMFGVSPKERMDDETYELWKMQTVERVRSEEFRQMMHDKMIGRKWSDESNAKKGRKGKEHYFYGKHMSEEQKEKLRQANLGKKYSNEINAKKGSKGAKNPAARAVNQYSKSGNFIKHWDYIKQASNELGASQAGIISCCRGRQKTCGGFVWKYADEDKK